LLNLDKKGSNLPFWICFKLVKRFSLFLGVDAKKLRKSLVLTEKKALGLSFEKEKRSHEVPRAWKASLESPREYAVGYAQKHNHARSLQ